MNFGFLYTHPPGESLGSINRMRSLINGLVTYGNNCFIFTPYEYNEDWGPRVKFINIARGFSKIVSPIYATIKKKIYLISRKILHYRLLSHYTILRPIILDLLNKRLASTLIDKLNRESFHLDYIIGVQEVAGLSLTQVKHELGCPIILDLHSYWPEELVEHRVIKRSSHIYIRLAEKIKEIISAAELVITVSEALNYFLKKQFSDPNKLNIETIYTGNEPVLKKPKDRRYPPKVINSGMIVQRSNIELFLKSLPYVVKKFPETQIYITKKGEKLKEIKKLAKKMNLKINFYWKDTHSEFLELLSECHLGVVTSTHDWPRRLGFVTKVYDYFSVGLPVVANDIGGWTKIISEEKVGLLSTDDPKDLANKIIQFIENPDMSYEYGLRGIELLNTKLNIKNTAKRFLEFIDKLKK